MPAVMLLVFAFTLFVSASLLFLIEPMVGKMMLPLMGGTPAVWNTCMVFFQAVLLAGYGYAHATTKWLGPRNQARAHLAVLVTPFLLFALNAALAAGVLAPNRIFIFGQESNPIPALLLVLTLSVGVPMFVVCTGAPLLQRWFASTDHPAARDPYFLYGASNLGSMLALVGYPFVVEPFLGLASQQVLWAAGYGFLTILIAVCAVLMWKSRPALEPAAAGAAAGSSTAVKTADKGVSRNKFRGADTRTLAPEPPVEHIRTGVPITWSRRLRWVLLAAVPSSLMLGVTTYITTDLAAIPLLWMPPLALYLLTFIIVFAVISVRTQNLMVFSTITVACLLLAWKGIPYVFSNEVIQLAFWVLALGAIAFGTQILRLQDPQVIHRTMIMTMPLLLLLLLFLMLSELKVASLWLNIGLHLLTLFVVSMVCHGELAADRPEPKHLTEFFLWMSFGGVVGGLFNGLVAPLVFNAIVEYQLMIVVACLLLPPLGFGRESPWARWVDVALGLVLLGIGVTLLVVRYYSPSSAPDLAPLKAASRWVVVAYLAAAAIWLPQLWKRWQKPAEPDGDEVLDYRFSTVLDFLLPLSLGVLVLGLYWGLPAPDVYKRVAGIAGWLRSKNINIDADLLVNVLTFGLPAVLCYTFVERWTRFGLGVGALLLAAGLSGVVKEGALYQDRSFFGVLKVEDSYTRYPGSDGKPAEFYYPVHRLVHGTTLHGKQIRYKDNQEMDEAVRETALSYYHRTGPVGQVFTAYNTDPKRPFAVIGLGTGTMASYGLPGQRVDFYDIDPVVVSISYDTNQYFTFVEDAEARGVDVNLVLGDARLTFEPVGSRPRIKPLHRRPDQARPSRRKAEPLTADVQYGLIVVDAFSSDAIPMHLITKEALKIYFERLLDDGVLCIHISNRYLDLHPVLANIAVDLGVEGLHMSDDDDDPPGKNRSHWVMLSRRKENMSKLFQVPRWKVHQDQLSLLGVTLWPATCPAARAGGGMAHAFLALCDLQSRQLVKEADRQGIPKYAAPAAPNWEPLETREYLESLLPVYEWFKLEDWIDLRDEVNRLREGRGELTAKDMDDLKKKEDELREVEQALRALDKLPGTPEDARAWQKALEPSLPREFLEREKRLDEMDTALEELKKPLKEAEKPFNEVRDQLEVVNGQLRTVAEQLKFTSGTNQSKLTQQQRELLRKKADLEGRLEPLRKKRDELVARSEWLSQVRKRLQRQRSYLKYHTRNTARKLATNRKVGVWTDDYSNLPSVFNW